MASHISIPSPCSANWADMAPAPGGRHCAACNKVVVDFSALSEANVLATLRQPGKVCGRFRPEQVVSDTAFPFSWARWLAAAAVSLSSCGTPDVAQVRLRTSTPAVEASILKVQGRVIDQENGLPLPQALIVSLADSTHHTHTDANGYFTLQLPAALRDSLLFVVGETSPQGNMQGYIGRRIKPANATEIRLRENPNYMMMGEPAPVALVADEWRPKPLPPKMKTIKFTPPAHPLPE
ncbi:hypothetical protein [Hymenobacter norwichensis]|uniref:hypothetical protein n=1 Tax=Hymenobacter norwichensis TaxID=223903 RepID=UPI0003B4A1C5|nr:hypothetical protein [Hymenobacter norwichensis]